MRWLKRILPRLLVLAASIVAVVTFFADHSDDYGQVALPQDTVSLPQGTVAVYVKEPASGSGERRLSAPLRFEVRPVGGGRPLAKEVTGKYGTRAVQTERSQNIGQTGSVVELEVPVAGTYAVHGRLGQPARPAELSFGTDSFAAVGDRWRLFAGLVGGAVLISLVPLPRRRQPAPEPEPERERELAAQPRAWAG